jgi:glutathione S-transferase
MGEIETTRADIRALSGVHLFHFGMSNCSQRVRLALEEKGVSWTSHSIDITKNAHLTADFHALNPAGVVPVLVHDGRTITESNDIIDYIDASFPGPSLKATNEADATFLAETLARSSAIQGSLKLVSHEFLFKPTRRMTPAQLDAFDASCSDAALARFMRDLNAPGSFGEVRIRAAVDDFASAFAALDQRLRANPWLSGAVFGLADISWFVNVHRLVAMRYPLRHHAKLDDWYRRMKARPSYRTAVDRYQPKPVILFFAGYSLIRRFRGTGIDRYARSATNRI